jgi:hypothetical protein
VSTPEAFFLPDGDGFVATELTRGPWNRDLQHGGPPSALLAHAVRRAAGPEGRIVRFTVDLLRPVPLGRVTIAVEPVREGRGARVYRARLSVGGKESLNATALVLRTIEVGLDPTPGPGFPRSPEESEPYAFTFFQDPVGYQTAMEIRIARGTWGKGPLAAWMRMRVPLVPGETPAPVERVLCAADSGNGMSPSLDPRTFTFVNPDLTVHLRRDPVGEWVGLDAATAIGSDGTGLAECALYDPRGPIGRSLQSLVVERRA